jgi:hypothetical protein
MVEMFSIKKCFVAAVMLAAIFLCSEASATGFDPKGYIVEDGLLYAVDEGQKKQIEGAEVVEDVTEGGTFYWLAVDPEADEENERLYKGWKRGIYFFGSDGKFISLLEKENAQISYIIFSPDGKQFLLSNGDEVDCEYQLHEFSSFKLKKTLRGMSAIWIDHMRYALTVMDESKKGRYEGADIPGWLSVVVYDSAVDLITTVTEATKKEDFMMSDFDSETGELIITKFSVKDEKDWADEEKREIDEIRVPVPPAG